MVDEHGQQCKRPFNAECRRFSTDGTQLGAEIAHTFGTTDEDEIARIGADEHLRRGRASLTGMTEEQAEWEGFEVDPDDDIYDEAWRESN